MKCGNEESVDAVSGCSGCSSTALFKCAFHAETLVLKTSNLSSICSQAHNGNQRTEKAPSFG